jgi:hypothetical protein
VLNPILIRGRIQKASEWIGRLNVREAAVVAVATNGKLQWCLEWRGGAQPGSVILGISASHQSVMLQDEQLVVRCCATGRVCFFRAAAGGPSISEWLDALAPFTRHDPALAHFRKFDEGLAAALASGAIRLLDAAALRADRLHALGRRQDLEARPELIFMRPAAAAAALLVSDRRVCFVTHPWRTVAHPDPDGVTLAALLRFLRSPLGAHVVGVFVDFACLHQHPRTARDEATFATAVKVVPHGYASLLGSTVARMSAVPPRPAELAPIVALVAAVDEPGRSSLPSPRMGTSPTRRRLIDMTHEAVRAQSSMELHRPWVPPFRH